MKGNGKSDSGFESNLLIAKLAHHGLLTREEERRLIRRAQRHDKAALTELVASNVRLVMTRVIKLGGHAQMDDLLPEGLIGLIIGVFGYDLKRPDKPKLSTYAVDWIDHAIRRWQANCRRRIRLPVHAEEIAWRISGETARFCTLNGREPTAEELAERINEALAKADADKDEDEVRRVNPEAVERIKLAAEARFIAVNHTDHSFEMGAAVVASENHLTPDFELILIEEGGNALDLVERAEAIGIVREAMSQLKPNEQAVINLRFVEGMTLEDAAVALHKRGVTATELTRERIRQIQERALDRLRPTLIKAGLAPEGFVYEPKRKGKPRRIRTRD